MRRKSVVQPASTSSSTGLRAGGGRNPLLSASTDVSGRQRRISVQAASGEMASGGRMSRLARSARAGGGLASLQEQLQNPESRASGAHGGVVNQEILNEMSAQDIRDLRLVFDTFDTHSRGKLNELELRRAMKCLGFKLSQKAAQEAIADSSMESSSNTLAFQEFLHCVIAHQGDSRDLHEEILHGFRMFDTAHKGKITMADLKRVCDEVGEKFSEQELQEMIEEADRDGDNAVSKQEFVNIMLRTNLFL